MRNFLLMSLLMIPLLSFAQTRTGGGTGPDVGESTWAAAFLIAVNENSKTCPGSITTFKNMGEFYLNYSLTYTLERQSKKCENGEIPKRFQCLTGGKASVLLKELISLPATTIMSDLSLHCNRHDLDGSSCNEYLLLLEDLAKQQPKNEKK